MGDPLNRNEGPLISNYKVDPGAPKRPSHKEGRRMAYLTAMMEDTAKEKLHLKRMVTYDVGLKPPGALSACQEYVSTEEELIILKGSNTL